jgi:hypothetical protein
MGLFGHNVKQFATDNAACGYDRVIEGDFLDSAVGADVKKGRVHFFKTISLLKNKGVNMEITKDDIASYGNEQVGAEALKQSKGFLKFAGAIHANSGVTKLQKVTVDLKIGEHFIVLFCETSFSNFKRVCG